MKHTTITIKAPLTVAGTVLLGLALSAPANARPDSESRDVGTPAPGLPYSQEAYENHYLSPLPESAPRPDPAPPEVAPVNYRFIDDNSIEVLQFGAGVLAGIAMGGAGAALVSRRNRGLAAPA